MSYYRKSAVRVFFRAATKHRVWCCGQWWHFQRSPLETRIQQLLMSLLSLLVHGMISSPSPSHLPSPWRSRAGANWHGCGCGCGWAVDPLAGSHVMAESPMESYWLSVQTTLLCPCLRRVVYLLYVCCAAIQVIQDELDSSCLKVKTLLVWTMVALLQICGCPYFLWQENRFGEKKVWSSWHLTADMIECF